MKKKFLLLFLFSFLLGIAGHLIGLTHDQSFILTIFSFSILGILFFWELRLSFLFIGSGLLVLTHSVDIEHFIKFASLDVILFLIGMMIITSMLKETGVFHWLLVQIMRMKAFDGRKLFITIMLLSATLSAMIGEVTSMIIMMVIILDICDSFKIDPLPLVISSVLTTNIGSASTLLGNPIGILIAMRGGLSFEDFLTHALPVSVIVLLITMLILCIWYRDYIKKTSYKLLEHRKDKDFLNSLSIDFDAKVSMTIFAVTIALIAFHKRLETLFGIEENNLLIILPIISAGIAMLCRRDKARYYIEHEIEWRSLLFFMFLFAQAGVIQSSGIAQFFAEKLVNIVGNHPETLSGAILFSSGILSGTLDNTVVVASYIPIVKSLNMLHISSNSLWWCILFGACYGGNITAIGSTANIIALGILEKQKNIKIQFFDWFKIGVIIGISSMLISYFIIILYVIYYNN